MTLDVNTLRFLDMSGKEVGIEDARKRLGDLVTAVQQGADITLTRNGKPAARIVRHPEASDMNALRTGRVDISIDGGRAWPGKIEIEQEFITYQSETATKPDPGWTFVDAAGHFHAYDDGGELPTLEAKRVHVDCDGVHAGPMAYPDEPCEGYDVTEWHCRICDAIIEPARLPDRDMKSTPGLKHWHAEITTTEIMHDQRVVSVRATTADGVYFGAAYARMVSAESRIGDGMQATIRLDGASPLGFRKH